MVGGGEEDRWVRKRREGGGGERGGGEEEERVEVEGRRRGVGWREERGGTHDDSY